MIWVNLFELYSDGLVKLTETIQYVSSSAGRWN